jgi:hypothetical protein
MAYTATFTEKTVHGDQRCMQIDVVADAASGSVFTGLSRIDHVQMSPISCTTTAFKIKKNTEVGSVASAGKIFFSSCVSGDVFTILALGR